MKSKQRAVDKEFQTRLIKCPFLSLSLYSNRFIIIIIIPTDLLLLLLLLLLLYFTRIMEIESTELHTLFISNFSQGL